MREPMKNTVKHVFSAFLGITIMTAAFIMALPLMTAAVFAADPVVMSGSEATGTNARQNDSNYTVEFTYNDLQYVLAGDESVALSEILSKVGLVGEATEVTVSNSQLFSASKENGRWVITSHKAFTSNEWMRVTIGDITYEITVTDDYVSGDYKYDYDLDENNNATI